MNNTIKHVTPTTIESCVDTDKGAKDVWDLGCSDGYTGHPEDCGNHDDNDFFQNKCPVNAEEALLVLFPAYYMI